MQRKPFVVALCVIAVIVVACGFFFWQSRDAYENVRIESDRTITGDFTVASTQRVILAKGAKLTVTGNMTVAGELVCEDGALFASVGGEFRAQNKVSCPGADLETGIAISAKTFAIEKSATLVSAGSIQLVDRPDKILVADQLEKAFDAVEADSGTGLRVGPLGTGNGLRSANPSNLAASVSPRIYALANTFLGVNAAEAQGAPEEVISGNIQIIGEGESAPGDIVVVTPAKRVKKVLLNFNFGSGNDVLLQDLNISGPAGRNGQDAKNTCTALGADGGDAMRFNVNADSLIVNNFRLKLGDGGHGGNATTGTDCDAAFATGGAGGKAGNFKMVATSAFEIRGSFDVTPGKAGNGGSAFAYGKNQSASCPGLKGGDATAKGGKGANANESLKAAGSIAGVANVIVHDIHAGDGGAALAKGGNGGGGKDCGCAAGAGGKASATGGIGGSSAGSTLTNTAAAYGGNGGNSDATAGSGGSGAACGPTKAGTAGATGGSATSKPGTGGNGATAKGADGKKQSEQGGNGGNGGDGCAAGTGGAFGTGNPNGNPGIKGKTTCVEPEKKKEMIQVINYNGKYIPLTQIHLANPDACAEKHWHGSPATATDGTVVTDPNPNSCGYCPLSQCPVIEIEKPAAATNMQVQTTVGEFQIHYR